MIDTLHSTLYSAHSKSGQTQQATSLAYQQRDFFSVKENFHLTTDTVELSYSREITGVYDRSLQLDEAEDGGFALLRGLVANIFRQQGMEPAVVMDGQRVELATLSVEDAKGLVAEDGYFGVEKTAERIVSFAIGVAGGNPEHALAIRKGVEQGMAEALAAFGGVLPQISHDTYQAVMDKIDAWAGEDGGQQELI